MSYLASKGTSLEDLAKQYSGRKFGEFVLYHMKLKSYEELTKAVSGLRESIHPKLKETTEEFLITITDRFSSVKRFWTTDCGDTLRIYTNATKAEAKKHGINVDDDYAFDIFNLISLTLALKASIDPTYKRFIKKSVRRFWIV